MLLGSLLEVSPHTPTALLNWTVRVKDIQPGSSGSNPRYLTDVGGTLFFSADDGISGVELWKSDGTEAGTVRRTLFQAPARWRGGRVRPDRPSEPGRNIGRPVATRRCSGVSLRVIPLHATKQDIAPSSRGPSITTWPPMSRRQRINSRSSQSSILSNQGVFRLSATHVPGNPHQPLKSISGQRGTFPILCLLVLFGGVVRLRIPPWAQLPRWGRVLEPP